MHVRGFFLTALTMIAVFALAEPAAKAQTITCSSDDGGRNYCPANTDGADVRMVRQRSDARCTQGYSWGYDRRGIWVDRGCRADFIVDYRHERHDDGHDSDGRGHGGGQTITCSSDDGGRNYCPANTDGADVRMVRQRSDARCTQGYSWGYDRRGIWVDRGCRADFIVDYRHERHDDGHDSDGRGYGGGQTITCSSDDGKRNYCPADTRHGVRMVRQRSDARCTQDYSWGYGHRGIWVDRGCRADFVTR